MFDFGWGTHTFSGCATIICTSMKMPGTPLETQERMGAPGADQRGIVSPEDIM